MRKAKPILEVIMGVPLPGQYDNLKGIDLYGDGEVFDRKEGKQPTQKFTDNQSQKVAKKTAKMKLLQEDPIFVQDDHPIPYREFVNQFGLILDEDSYDLLVETYLDHQRRFQPEPEKRFLYTFEAVHKNPFQEKWMPIIAQSASKSNYTSAIRRAVSNFVNANSEALTVRYPTVNITLGKAEVDQIMKIGGFTPDEVKEAATELLSNLDAKTEFKSYSKSPHQIILTGMIVQASRSRKESLVRDLCTILAFTLYPLIFRKYFPRTNPNPYAMEEAILTASRKFHITKSDSLLEWVQELTMVPYQFYQKQFESGTITDLLFVQFLNRLRNTMNQQFRSLYSIYKKAYENRSLSRLNDDDFVTLGSNLDKIQIYTMTIMDKMKEMGFRANICQSAAKYTKTVYSILEVNCKKISERPDDYDLQTLTQEMLTIYFTISKGQDFLSFAIHKYQAMTKSKDTLYKKISIYLDKLDAKLRKEDPAFLRRYLYGIYIYFAIIINILMNTITNKLAELSLSLKNNTDPEKGES